MFQERKESLYVVFGEHTERVAAYLEAQGYTIVGKDRTLDAAAIMAPNLDELPETYLVLGSALVSGVVDAGINYGAALIENLNKLRLAAPKSRIVLILPESAEPEVLQSILYLGIYDVHRTDAISVSQLPGLLSVRKTIADFGLKTLPIPVKTEKHEVALEGEEDEEGAEGFWAKIWALITFVRAFFKIPRSRKSLKARMNSFRSDSVAEFLGKQEPKEQFQYELSPVGNFEERKTDTPGEEKVTDVLEQEEIEQEEELEPKPAKAATRSGRPDLFARLFFHGRPGIIVNGGYVESDWKAPVEVLGQKCDAVVIPAGWGVKAIREIRRDPRSRVVPIVVFGAGRRAADFLRAGADLCVKRLTSEVVEQATSLSRRYRELWSGAETDPLTGLYARSFFNAWLAEQEKRPEPLFSVALIDIDHFKSFNDRYGHQAGDAVLAAFGEFLKTNTRACDVAARWGGEEFVVGLPNTPAKGAHALIERLRKRWVERKVHLPSGESVSCTFSAGVAGYKKGCDVVAEADEMLYKAKESGRNRVESSSPPARKVLLLGQKAHSLMARLREEGIEVTADPADASLVLTDLSSFSFAPDDRPLVVIGTGTVADFAVKRSRPDAEVVPEGNALGKVTALVFGRAPKAAPVLPGVGIEVKLEPALGPRAALGAVPAREFSVGELKPPGAGREKLAVLPGGRSGEKGLTLASGSALYVVCPSRPGLAGEAAARLARDLPGSALVCAAPESTGALALGIPERELITSDWRIPGSNAPLGWGGITVWPVDPLKFLNVRDVSPNALVESIKPKFPLVVVDCAGSLDIAGRASRSDGIVVLHREGDSADAATAYWIRSYPGNNVLVCAPSEAPDILPAENGFVLLTSSPRLKPGDSL